MSEFRGNINYGVPEELPAIPSHPEPLPQLEGYPYDTQKKEVNSSWHGFLVVFFILIIVSLTVLAGLFVYYVSEGKFETDIRQDITPIVNMNTTVENDNDYSFNPKTDNNFNNEFVSNTNITIVIEEVIVHTNSS